MEIRKLTEADYEQAAEMYVALDELHARMRPDMCAHRDKEESCPREPFVKSLTDPASLQLGAFDGQRLAGIAGATLWEDSGMVKGVRNVCLDNIYVLPDYRRRGIAAKLFAQVEAWARERGAVRLDVYTWDFNREAIALYQTVGMTPQQYVFEKKL